MHLMRPKEYSKRMMLKKMWSILRTFTSPTERVLILLLYSLKKELRMLMKLLMVRNISAWDNLSLVVKLKRIRALSSVIY